MNKNLSTLELKIQYYRKLLEFYNNELLKLEEQLFMTEYNSKFFSKE